MPADPWAWCVAMLEHGGSGCGAAFTSAARRCPRGQRPVHRDPSHHQRRDIVRVTLERVRAVVPDISEEALLAAELRVRAEWGGLRADVWKTLHGRAGRQPRKQQP